MSPNSLLNSYKRLIRQAGVPEITFHDLRDSHASRLLAQGVDIGAVSERLRHTSKSTTLNRYIHVVEAQRRRAAMTMDELFDS